MAISNMEPAQLYPSKRKWIGVVAISVSFVALGIWLVFRDAPLWVAWASILFFGVCAAVSILQLLPGIAWLRLDEAGFTFRNFYRTKSYNWQEIAGFGVATVSGQDMVIFETGGTSRLADVNRQLAGGDQALPDCYGLSAPNLARLMADYRARSLRQPNRDQRVSTLR